MAALPSPRGSGDGAKGRKFAAERRISPGGFISPGDEEKQGPHGRPGGHGNKAHIGEVQSSLWDEANVEACEAAGVRLL